MGAKHNRSRRLEERGSPLAAAENRTTIRGLSAKLRYVGCPSA
jgi:hypothetical protein